MLKYKRFFLVLISFLIIVVVTPNFNSLNKVEASETITPNLTILFS